MTRRMQRRARGFFGIGVWHPKQGANVGTLWRHANLYEAQFIFTIGARYRHQCTDTTKAELSIPLYEHDDLASFEGNLPRRAEIVCVELTDKAKPLDEFVHPEQAVYLLGAEDHGLPDWILHGRRCVQIASPGHSSMNVSTAGTLVMYDRYVKTTQFRRLKESA